MIKARAIVLAALALLSARNLAQAAVTPLMRYPTISSNSVAFVARGDLWSVARDGGRARLVARGGMISAPRFSPDGRWIAFSERRGGGQDVYVVSAAGGTPHRLTFDARARLEDNLVVGWTPDGSRLAFLSGRGAWASRIVRAFTVPVDGGLPEILPLGEAGLLSFASDGGAIAFTRTFTAFDARKRYVGGRAPDIFTYDLSSHRLTQITDWKGADTAPMWAGRRIYFLSDRGQGFRANLWCYDLDTHASRQVTRFEDYDVDWPSPGPGRIAFQQGGHLWALDLPSEHLHEIKVDVPDDGEATTKRLVDVSRQARASDVSGTMDYTVSPKGDAAAFSAHGDIFSVAATGGVSDLTGTPAVDDEHPSWSPDGRMIAYVTEADGAQQVAVRPAGGGAEKRLTHFVNGVFYAPVWSSDGASLAVADAEHGLWWVHRSGAPPRLVARDDAAEIRDAAFSADGRWLAYSTSRPTGVRALHLQELETARDTVVSSPMESDRLPAFSPDGRTLYFVSQRHELPFTSDRGDEAAVSTLKSDGVYAAALTRPEAGSGTSAPRGVDLDGLMSRAIALPVVPTRIVSLETRGREVIYEARPPALIDGELPGETSALHVLDPAAGHDRTLLTDFESHALSADGARVLFRRGRGWRILELATGGESALDILGLEAQVDPRAEWTEVFERAWRLDRDLFFSRTMNGDDWIRVHDAYARLLPRLGSRDDLLYLLRELQGELATSHAFVGGLDAQDPSPPMRTPRLGADLTLDVASGRYRIARLYVGDATRERFRSPMGAPGSGVATGDYLLAVNGRELKAPTDPDSLLAGAEGDLTLSLAARLDGPRRDVRVHPLENDLQIRQHDWIESNRERVSELSGGRVGYIFVADFNALGSEDLLRQLQPQLDKEGLVIDIRWNTGGFTSQAVLNLLKRVHAGVFVNREGALNPLPLFVAPRAMATIANAGTASDGDQFAYFFQALGLGPVIGQRTWGGVQGIKGPWPFMDGSTITVPKDSLASTNGHWLIENEGVRPSTAVDPAPDETVTGRDRLLEAAVAAVLERIPKYGAPALRPPPSLPAYPPGGDVPGAGHGRILRGELFGE